ncbi:hypothetical protein ICL16_13290 [Iningainema sp. BLCCT55]|uniref:Uncharacterized protein n=2 Tax=Iningainema TaxID=1932705 RepID=A0A8J6XGW4_9CYAN|nr:hypothetical protein [Iningainema tapete]MBD2773020.1 hypothetical protein [Iningainema tapete BLCC-T55]
MSEYPKAFDIWRLWQYFDSIGIEKISYLSKDFDVSDEDGIEELFNCLLHSGVDGDSPAETLRDRIKTYKIIYVTISCK